MIHVRLYGRLSINEWARHPYYLRNESGTLLPIRTKRDLSGLRNKPVQIAGTLKPQKDGSFVLIEA